MAGKMAPPGHGVAVIIAEKPQGADQSKRMPPPGQSLQHSSEGKADPAEAGVVREDSHCIDCEHYDSSSGECEKVAGILAPSDGCVRYFQRAQGDNDDEPDADEQGGPSDNDADDQGAQQQ